MTRHESRVTVDVDGHRPRWKLRALRAYHSLQRWCERVDVRVSASGGGLHIIGWSTEPLDLEQRLDIRRELSDDRNRARMDDIRGEVGHTTGVCWTEKQGQEADLDFSALEDAFAHIEASEPWVQGFKDRVQKGLVR